MKSKTGSSLIRFKYSQLKNLDNKIWDLVFIFKGLIKKYVDL